MIKDTIKMVVFDMAGTTVDEQNVVYKTLHKAIVAYGIETSLATVLEFGAGKEKHQAIKDILNHLNYEVNNSNVIFENFKKMLNVAYEVLEVKPIKGVQKVILELRSKNIIVVLNTGYNREIASLLLGKMKWKEGVHYDALITASDVEVGRPYPEMIEKAMKMFQVDDASSVLKAGDSAIDIEEGKNAKCGVTIGVLSGAQTKEQIIVMKPDYIIDSLADLKVS